MNFLKQSQAAFFNKYGYIHLQNQLPYHMKFKLLNSINTVEFDSMNKKHLYNHNFELDSSNNKVLSRSEYFAHSKTYINSFSNNMSSFIKDLFDCDYTLYKEKINYKYPNTGSYKAHQDITAYPKSKNHITCLIPLCNTYKMNGSIQFSPLTTNNLQNNHILDNQDGVIIDESKLSWLPPVFTNFGDIILFDSYIPHKSTNNISDSPRKSLYLTFNPSDEGNNREYYYDLKKKNNNSTKLSLINHYDGNLIENTLNNNLHKDYVIKNIINLYKNYGHTYYDANFTQEKHAFATVKEAIFNCQSEKLILACFLHDIGHLLLNESQSDSNFLQENLRHETIAYNFLKQYYPDFITKPILLHVQAKRYLCSTRKPYYDKLSDSSKKSFHLQGGFMTDYHIKKFESNKYFNDAVKLRELEDMSKTTSHKFISFCYDDIEKLLYKYYI